MWLLGGLVLVLALALSACGSTAEPPRPLDGTSWRLLSLESMSDQQGTTTVDDPSRYTVEFGTDGRAAFRIDCNRGNSDLAGRRGGAGLRKPVVRADRHDPDGLPAARHWSGEVSTALGYVRGFLLKDGRLHMSLLADGGILHWEPQKT